MRGKKGTRLSLGVLTVICAAVFSACGTKTVKQDDPVMEINQEIVVKEEYQMILNNYVAQVKAQYTTEEANQKDFWRTEFADGRPIDKIMQLAKEDFIHKKTVAQLAKEAGIEQKTDYRSLLELAEGENQEREEKLTAGELVYGLTSYKIKDYYTYTYIQVEAEVLEELKKDHAVYEEELKQVYQENKDEYTSEIEVQTLVAELHSEEAMDLAKQVALVMKQEENMEVLSEQFPSVGFYEITMSSLNTEEGKSGAYAQRWIMASALQQGEVSEPFGIGENLMVLRCLNREENATEDFEEVKGELKSQLQTQLAKEDLKKKVENAEVSFDENVLEQAALEVLEAV